MPRFFLACAALYGWASASLLAQGTAFTYQGVLSQGGAASNGSHDLTFTLYDAADGGETVGPSNLVNDLTLTNGLFTVTLNFGAGTFDGSGRWLQIAARPGDSTGAYTNLSPRQPVTATPYAVYAGGANAAGLTGAINDSLLSSNVPRLDGGNTFTESQTIRTSSGGLVISSSTGGQFGSGTLRVQGNTGLGADPHPDYRLFVRGSVYANGFTGNGSGLTGVNAVNAVDATKALHANTADTATEALNFKGSVADEQLSANVPKLDGKNTFAAPFAINTGAGILSVVNEGGLTPGLSMTGGPNPGILRLRNALDVWPNTNGATAGRVDVRNTIGNPVITLDGANGRVTAASYAGNGSGLSGLPKFDGGNAFTGNQVVVNGSGFFGDHSSGLSGVGAGVRVFRDTTTGAGSIFAYNYATGLPLPLTLQQPGGNVGIGTTTPSTKLDVAGEITATAVNLTSDRNAKQDFKPVNVREVLEKVVGLPISEWRYKTQSDARHIGPMAQDFHAAFAVGRDEKHITSVDADGVALAAIQGLNEKLEDQARQSREKDDRIRDLAKSVEELKTLLNQLTTQRQEGAK